MGIIEKPPSGAMLDKFVLWLGKLTDGRKSVMGMALIVAGVGVLGAIKLGFLNASWNETGVALAGTGFSVLITGATHKMQKNNEYLRADVGKFE